MLLTIAPGTRLGPYEIVDWLGAGGMGEVYRARDSRLARDVALKLIAPAFAADPDRLYRFEQEARAAGQLNHPNVLAVYDVGNHGGTPYIVAELLDGESLRRRLERGPLPARKAIQYARQVAEGLAAAHDRKIVHRDIKPDNLFVTTGDRIKILDFGIGKLTQLADETSAGGGTKTADDVVLGTTAYMSPEQLCGEPVDGRSDIFSLGVVFYEALTGHAPFARPTQAETVAAVLKEEPPGLPPTLVSPALARTLERCLEKGREARFQSARDLAFGLGGLSDESGTVASTARVSDRRVIGRRSMLLVLGGLIALALRAVWARIPWLSTSATSAGGDIAALESTELHAINLGSGRGLNRPSFQFGDSVALSPNGQRVAFVAGADRKAMRLYLRTFGPERSSLSAISSQVTKGAVAPFFSPSGNWLGFFAEGRLKKVNVNSPGSAIDLCAAPAPRGGCWIDEDTIVFAPDREPGTRILRYSSGGKAPVPVTTLADCNVMHVWPQVLPGGRWLLYTASSHRGHFNDADFFVQDLKNVERPPTRLDLRGYHGRYVQTGPETGHLVFVRNRTLMAVRFDPDGLKTIGTPVMVPDGGVESNPITGGAQFALSPSGRLLYYPGATGPPGDRIHSLDPLDPKGEMRVLRTTPDNWFNLTFAPDGEKLAVEIRDDRSYIGICDLKTGQTAPLISEPIQAQKPVWSPGSRYVVFAAGDCQMPTNLWLQEVKPGSAPEPLTNDSTRSQRPGSWRPDGSVLAFEQQNVEKTRFELMMLRMTGSDTAGWTPGESQVFGNAAYSEREPVFSPDGNWVAYERWAAGDSEVWVAPFPGPGNPVKVSTDKGSKPTWSTKSPKLFYGTEDGQLMVVTYTPAGGSLEFETARRLWSNRHYLYRGPNRMFAQDHRDGRVAIAAAPDFPESPDEILMWTDFFEVLRRVAV